MRRALFCALLCVSCAGIAKVFDTASEHVVQIAIGGGVGLAVGAATGGISLLPIAAAAVAASTATLLATPPSTPVIIQSPPHPLSTAVQYAAIGIALWFLFRNRDHLLAAVKGRTLAPVLHALIGGSVARQKA